MDRESFIFFFIFSHFCKGEKGQSIITSLDENPNLNSNPKIREPEGASCWVFSSYFLFSVFRNMENVFGLTIFEKRFGKQLKIL